MRNDEKLWVIIGWKPEEITTEIGSSKRAAVAPESKWATRAEAVAEAKRLIREGASDTPIHELVGSNDKPTEANRDKEAERDAMK